MKDVEQKGCYHCVRDKSNPPACKYCCYDVDCCREDDVLAPGFVLKERYLVSNVLLRDAFSITYLGMDIRLNIPVAIKEFFPVCAVMREKNPAGQVSPFFDRERVYFEQNRFRFLRDVQTLAKLTDTPEVILIRDFFTENNTVYVVKNFAEGITLKEYVLRKGGRIGVEETLTLLRPLLEAMVKVHEIGFLHREIRPDTILIRSDRRPQLIDFVTTCEPYYEAFDAPLPPMLLYGFGAPEQLKRHGELGPWTDIYSICGTIYFCLTGKKPPSVSDRLLEESEFDWESIPGLKRGQRKVLHQGTAFHHQDRIQSMKELNAGLFL